ncbi:MAG: VCBS repeat-containing protein [Nanoarchaeota archaeon]|nr:VCBS repeat-containing protein [Nanoarchaeota archaeon]MBU1631998.1 VCBS repeat-containing protein [Nanoarchaeota archaeon]MBU1875613.1 VCBS repeat-containing protein [Nanoarchaeota archaeon]
MKKTLTALLLAGAIGLAGCDKGNENYSTNKPTEPAKPANVYQFQGFGDIGNVSEGMYRDVTQIETADVDGDGDLDIIVGTETGRIVVYENKMPQKGQ